MTDDPRAFYDALADEPTLAERPPGTLPRRIAAAGRLGAGPGVIAGSELRLVTG